MCSDSNFTRKYLLCRQDLCKMKNSERKTVLTYTGVQSASQTLEICLRMLQNNIACFQGLHLSFVQFDVFVLFWSASL
jgi:hypothetical protein